jgi:histidyl-tRNA synthetase
MQGKQLPQLVKGTRDFNASQLLKRNYIFDQIRQVYQSYGFSPLETPALEHVSTLLGNYGADGEQLIFRILNSGDFLAEVTNPTAYTNYKKLLPQIADKGLRYDLTVPLMRYVATHHHELVFPFKRYQIQPVWRADRPQKGRYREFYQCDADVVGTSSLLIEAEILSMIHEVLTRLGITQFKIAMNHRAILNGIVALMGKIDQINEFCIVIDKLDKVGREKVIQELIARGFTDAILERFSFIFDLQGSNQHKLQQLNEHLAGSEISLQGVQEIQRILHRLKALGISDKNISIEPSLARGLSYYTGTVFEVKLQGADIGSVAGGGRYDNFAAEFGLTGMTGVGLSFGVDRLYVAMESLDLFPEETYISTQVMFTHLDEEAEKIALSIIPQLRKYGISTELYPEPVHLKKQLSYANKKLIPFVVLIGEEGRQAGKFTLKNMHTGEQTLHTQQELINFLREI